MEIKSIIIVGLIGSFCTVIVEIIVKKTKQYVFAMQKKNDAKKTKKKKESLQEQQEENEWKKNNDKIKWLLERHQDFCNNWKSSLPPSELRLDFAKNYYDICNLNLTLEQKNNVFEIANGIYKMYSQLINSKNVSKKEKKYYYDFLEWLREIERG